MTYRSTALASLVASVVAFGAIATIGAQEWRTKSPTAADWAAMAKLPDFNGVWETGRAPAVAGRPPVELPPPGAAPPRAGVAGGRQGGGRAAGGRGAAPGGGGRGGAPAGPQLTAAYEAKRAELAGRKAEDTESANCLPPGMPGIMGQPYPMEFILSPGKVTIVIEAYTQVRHIYTDGRPLPADPDPKFFGTSVGHWDGDTLVVDTVGFSPEILLTANTPHSDKMKINERFRLTSPDVMTMETTVTDPDALTAPWTTTRTLIRHRDWTISEYICEENNRNYVDASGKAGIRLDK
ncbi:MAG TPA: hypothetical protein VL173_02050 [Vicinamibacterales bacterium]|jgi:hypothetical protein|nr:hypothetical protein [Vicinamibacterales bacterium]